MIGKVIFWAIFLGAIGVIGVQLYENLPRSPINLVYEKKTNDNSVIIDYGDTPVFSENLRFNHDEITYHISDSCSREKERRMKSAFGIFEETFGIIRFAITQREFADIKVACSDAEVSIGENLFTVGEGGPSKIINTSQFKVIEEGKISLYKETSKCDYPVVELHELLHVFGFDHTPNPKSIMYNVSACDQRITPDMIRVIKNLYSVAPLPDLKITDLQATKRGRYLDFNVTILNEGLIGSLDFDLSIIHKGEEVEVFEIEEIKVGHGRTIKATNVRLPTLRVDALNFIVDKENRVAEFKEDNNIIQMKVRK